MTSLDGLARAHRRLGNVQRADDYQARSRRYRARNPYYHFARAQVAYQDNRYDESLAAIEAALNLKRRNPAFLFLKGATEDKLGLTEQSARSFQRAKPIPSRACKNARRARMGSRMNLPPCRVSYRSKASAAPDMGVCILPAIGL